MPHPNVGSEPTCYIKTSIGNLELQVNSRGVDSIVYEVKNGVNLDICRSPVAADQGQYPPPPPSAPDRTARHASYTWPSMGYVPDIAERSFVGLPPPQRRGLPGNPTWGGPPNMPHGFPTWGLTEHIANAHPRPRRRAAPSQDSQHPPSGIIPDGSKKIYCSHWVRTGECDFTQTGCLYKHEMPRDLKTLRGIGLSKVPTWWLQKEAEEAKVLAEAVNLGFAQPPPNTPIVCGISSRRRVPAKPQNGPTQPGRHTASAPVPTTTTTTTTTGNSTTAAIEALRQTRQMLGMMNIGGTATSDCAAGVPTEELRRGSVEDLLLDVGGGSGSPSVAERYAEHKARMRSPGLLSPATYGMGARPPAPSALDGNHPAQGSAPAGEGPASPTPPFRRFFVDCGMGAIGEGRRVRAPAGGGGAQLARGGAAQPAERERENGTAGMTRNGAAPGGALQHQQQQVVRQQAVREQRQQPALSRPRVPGRPDYRVKKPVVSLPRVADKDKGQNDGS